jgi:hypothetical protein
MHVPGLAGTGNMILISCGFLDRSSIPFFRFFLFFFTMSDNGSTMCLACLVIVEVWVEAVGV